MLVHNELRLVSYVSRRGGGGDMTRRTSDYLDTQMYILKRGKRLVLRLLRLGRPRTGTGVLRRGHSGQNTVVILKHRVLSQGVLKGVGSKARPTGTRGTSGNPIETTVRKTKHCGCFWFWFWFCLVFSSHHLHQRHRLPGLNASLVDEDEDG